MKYIELTRGYQAIVDDDDYEDLVKYNWHHHKNGYAMRHERVNGKRVPIRMHRVVISAPDGYDVDHKNGDKLDNRKANLRLATRSQNNYNKGVQSNSSSGFKGVSWSKQRNKWRARIHVDKKEINLGFFEYQIDAAFAYNEAAIKYHGEFAKLNEFNEVVCE
jgi:HNH endonuclease/AP2 domain